MPSVTIQDFHADVHAAELASEHGPVFITEEGEPRRVLIGIGEYRRLGGREVVVQPGTLHAATNLVDALAMPENEYFEWEPPRLEGPLFEPADFS